MKITNVETARLGRVTGCVRVDTDEGITGFGEACENRAPGAVFEIIRRIADEYLVGEDPRAIERHRRHLQDVFIRHEGVMVSTAIGALEHALWDIQGKRLGVPVYELLGGPVRDEVRAYRWINVRQGVDSLPRQAEDLLSEGFDAIKFTPFVPGETSSYPQCVPEVREVVRTVREAVGPDVDLMLDPVMRWKLAEARHVLSELEEFDILFAEDFTFSYRHVNPRALEKLANGTRIPIALGSDLFRLSQFEEIIYRDAAAVLQPDIAHAGISEIEKIAAAAEHRDIRIAPHNPFGPIATAAAVHVDLAYPNFLIQETTPKALPEGIGLGEYVSTDVEFENGRVPAPTAPGLGVSVDDGAFEAEVQSELPEPAWYSGGPGEHTHLPEW